MRPPHESPLQSTTTFGAATRTARAVVLASIIGVIALATAMVVERLQFLATSERALLEVKTAQSLADEVLLEDERLTMSALMASATGDARWQARYEARLPEIDKAIARATAMATPESAGRFDQATRVANDSLVALERQAFDRIAKGDLPGAHAILTGPEYLDWKSKLSSGTDVFMAELQATVHDRQREGVTRSWAVIAALLLAAGLGFAALWRHLQIQLSSAEAAFAAQHGEVVRLALHDPLTNLPNRRKLRLDLEGAVARAARSGRAVATLLIDLDGFKPVNDRLGHEAGDAVLVEVGRRLTAAARQAELTARLGGDEFVLVLEGIEGSVEAARAAERVIAELSEPIVLPHGKVSVSASVGVAFFPGDATEAADLLRKADVALYRAKQNARGTVSFFQQSMDDEVRSRQALSLELRPAIADGQIQPYFQPILHMASGRVVGFEVLARWLHPKRGLVGPVEFIPLAEQSGLIDALAIGVLRAALQAASGWDPTLSLAINISPRQLRDASLPERLMAVLAEAGFSPRRLEVEITETALIGDTEVARDVVRRMRTHGMRIALDDFGTGHSSLSLLSELPFDKIKIDRSFVQTMHDRRESLTIVQAIVSLGRNLRMVTTAEGIETPADAEVLARLGCDQGQGYLYAKPMPAADVAGLLASHAHSAQAG